MDVIGYALAQAIPATINTTEVLWAARAPMPAPRRDHALTALTNGDVLVVGGYATTAQTDGSRATYRYDAVANTWTTKAPVADSATFLPASDIAVYQGVLAQLANGYVTLNGGRRGSATGGSVLLGTARYDPAANTWAWMGSTCPVNFIDGNVGSYAGGNKVWHAFSGGGGASRVYDYDTDSWSASITSSVSADWSAAWLPALGLVFLSGGASTVPDAYTFDPVAKTYTTKARPIEGRIYASAARMPDGKVITMGGAAYRSGTTVNTGDTVIYDVVGNTSAMGRPNADITRYGEAALTGAGEVLNVGGQLLDGTNNGTANTYAYKPVTVVTTPGRATLLAHLAAK